MHFQCSNYYNLYNKNLENHSIKKHQEYSYAQEIKGIAELLK